MSEDVVAEPDEVTTVRGSEPVLPREPATADSPWRVVLLSRAGAEVLPDERIVLEGVPVGVTSADVHVWTRQDHAGFPAPLPRELVVEVHLAAGDATGAVASAGQIAGGLAAIISLAVNSYVAAPEPFLAFESAPGLSRRKYWQRWVTFESGLPTPKRRIDLELLRPVLEAVFSSDEHRRLATAISQYHVALSHWTTRGRPLALAHLYMGLEALGPIAERRERKRLGLPDEREHAVYRGVDVSLGNWREVLLGWVRRDVLCEGDKPTYDAARKASDSLEHGSVDLEAYRKVAEAHGRQMLDYVRGAIVGLLALPEGVRTSLAAKTPLDVSPLWLEVYGELHGDVGDADRLAEDGAAFPFAEWETTLDTAERLDNRHLRISPRVTMTMHLAKGVGFTPTQHGLGVGLSDPELFDAEIGESEAVVTSSVQPDGEPNARLDR